MNASPFCGRIIHSIRDEFFNIPFFWSLCQKWIDERDKLGIDKETKPNRNTMDPANEFEIFQVVWNVGRVGVDLQDAIIFRKQSCLWLESNL